MHVQRKLRFENDMRTGEGRLNLKIDNWLNLGKQIIARQVHLMMSMLCRLCLVSYRYMYFSCQGIRKVCGEISTVHDEVNK